MLLYFCHCMLYLLPWLHKWCTCFCISVIVWLPAGLTSLCLDFTSLFICLSSRSSLSYLFVWFSPGLNSVLQVFSWLFVCRPGFYLTILSSRFSAFLVFSWLSICASSWLSLGSLSCRRSFGCIFVCLAGVLLVVFVCFGEVSCFWEV